MGRSPRAVLLCASVLAGMWATAAAAQPAAQPADKSGDSAAQVAAERANTIQTLIVTAQKREENAQTVPIALTALSGQTLERQGVIGFADLSTRVPSLRFGAGVTGGENVITLRGIGSQNTTAGGDSPVAYNLDGVYLARTTSVDAEFFDINRIEVLRGPQGTLYGRNSVGGSINVITNHPSDAFAGHVDAAFGNYADQVYRGWINAPLYSNGEQAIDARLTVVRAQHDPYQKNLFNGPGASHNGDAQDFWLVRGELLFRFSDKANLLLIGSNTWNGDPVATKTQWWEMPARYVGAQPYLSNPREVRKNSPEMYGNNAYYGSATFTWDLGFATLTSVTGYASGKWKQSSDADASELTLAANPFWTMRQFQNSEELRLASNTAADQPLSWIVGGFAFREKAHQDFLFFDTGLNDPNALFDTFVFRNGGDYRTLSWAPFGQVDYDLGKTGVGVPVTLTLGLRYSHDTKKGADFLNYALPLIGFALPEAKTFDRSWTQTTGKVEVSYHPSPNFMAYANASTGYLSGGGLVGNFPGLYEPEKVKSYEGGFKSTLLDERLLFNAAIYHEAITNMQVFVQDITGSRIDNAGRAHVNGLELEAITTPVEGLRLNANATFTDAKYDEYETIDNRYATAAPGCDPTTRLCNFAGHRLVQTPKMTFDVGAQYVWRTAYGEITPRVDVFYSSDLYFLSANSAFDRQKPYTFVDADVFWRLPDRRFSLEAFGRNLGNSTVISNDGLQSNTIGEGFGMDNFAYFPPRTYGVRLGFDF